MAATLTDLLSQIRGKEEKAELRARVAGRKKRNPKLAKDILDHYKFPGDEDEKESSSGTDEK